MPTVRSPEYVPTGGGEERLYNLCFSYNEAEYPYLYQELEREIQRITDSLPQRCREVFILSRFQGMKNREIAERLHISLQAVEKHIQKALRIFFRDARPREFPLYDSDSAVDDEREPLRRRGRRTPSDPAGFTPASVGVRSRPFIFSGRGRQPRRLAVSGLRSVNPDLFPAENFTASFGGEVLTADFSPELLIPKGFR